MTTFLVHDHILILKILVVIGSNPVRDSVFFFVPRSWHADYFIFTVIIIMIIMIIIIIIIIIIKNNIKSRKHFWNSDIRNFKWQ